MVRWCVVAQFDARNSTQDLVLLRDLNKVSCVVQMCVSSGVDQYPAAQPAWNLVF